MVFFTSQIELTINLLKLGPKNLFSIRSRECDVEADGIFIFKCGINEIGSAGYCFTRAPRAHGRSEWMGVLYKGELLIE